MQFTTNLLSKRPAPAAELSGVGWESGGGAVGAAPQAGKGRVRSSSSSQRVGKRVLGLGLHEAALPG